MAAAHNRQQTLVRMFLCFDHSVLISFTAMCSTITVVHGSGRGGVAAMHTAENDDYRPMHVMTIGPQYGRY